MADVGSVVLGAAVGGAISLATSLTVSWVNRVHDKRAKNRERLRDASLRMLAGFRCYSDLASASSWTSDEMKQLAAELEKIMGALEEIRMQGSPDLERSLAPLENMLSMNMLKPLNLVGLDAMLNQLRDSLRAQLK